MEAILWSMETILRHAEAVCDTRKLLPCGKPDLPYIEPDLPYRKPIHRNGERLLPSGDKNQRCCGGEVAEGRRVVTVHYGLRKNIKFNLLLSCGHDIL